MRQIVTDEERRTKLALNDVRLQALIEAEEAQDRDQVLEDFIATEAGPLIRQILSSYRSTPFSQEDREDLLSTVHLRLIGKLRRVLQSTDHFIRNLNDYVASLTYNTLYEAMRRRFPERRRLTNRIRYAVQHDARLVLIAEGDAGICAIREQGPPFVPVSNRAGRSFPGPRVPELNTSLRSRGATSRFFRARGLPGIIGSS